ncbi:MAG: hypothetical protein BEN19_06005 [Epulopiscium sp. Nuni2H_MBin003]|nr:MAG: hypothetical protein BEN19_06005 [Epulopiscium sp. Nuni2H_MBin003]
MSSLDAAKFAAFINSYSGSTGILDGGEVVMQSAGLLGGGIESTPRNDDGEQQKEKLQAELNNMKEELEKFIEAEGLENRVEVQQDGEEVVLTFADFLLFDPGMADIKAGAIPVLNTVGLQIKEYLNDGFIVRSEGHTDNVPINTAYFPSNWELSAARAIVVAKFFINELDFDPQKISAEGFGEYYPVASNDTAEGREANRRVEIKIVKDAIP